MAEWIDDMRAWPPVMYGDIYNYLVLSKAVDGDEMKNFKSLSSYQYFQSGHVGKIVYQRKGNTIILKTDVIPGQSVNKENYTAWVECEESGTISTGMCTCMAGQGKTCSHIGALLWKIEYAVRTNKTGLACTDEQLKWNCSTQKNIEPKAIQNISFGRHQPTSRFQEIKIAPTPRLDFPQYLSHDDFFKSVEDSDLLPLFKLRNTTLYSSFSAQPTVQVRTPDLVHDCDHTEDLQCQKCTDFYMKLVFSNNEQKALIESQTRLQSDSLVWADSRRLRITASTAHKVPVRPTTNPDRFLREHVYPRFSGNSATRHGTHGEKLALEQLHRDGFNVTKRGTVISRQQSWLSASPDGIISDDTLLEIKCPVPSQRWSKLEDLFTKSGYDVQRENDQLKLRETGGRGYYMQIQITMFCTGLKRCKLVIWTSEEYSVVDVAYNEAYVGRVVDRLRVFYFTHMLPRLADDFASKRLILNKAYTDMVL